MNLTKRTIDHYTNLGLLEAERSPSNYRYYDHSAIDRIHLIEQWKSEGMSLVDIKKKLLDKDVHEAEEIDVRELRLKINGLKEDVSEVLAHLNKSDAGSQEYIKKNVSSESMSLIQTLLLLLK
ncbi:MerR family transcriptional regulator, copper efflux regulator [Cytobacillus horneckiae]|uniref:MerR family transcriptional regulator n=1 Tax=Cytobacillus horneckiae TaxID=549687 RepID=UPI000A576B74|nr:MerR family transcriptional regulator [Cytobacillus horneckiae]MCM3176520.1 MerR family transcriptional regulator [Cytobacillus horneckiae]MEC1159149.1 MerR family transcriptional regulator [Cytobacillus horneckiae]MED2938841.1 MerR family transcriptional regulator [Cytobacillus horneckiae]